ncbi:MAG: bifunctional folylpolyglutamate synthase/dihydrofolate synthase [Syntrophomonadaceae bacterium]|nr:bifunctional folylpolyglutamate synthase/dihydrofolate synthase [Syntrophomonadaceae bacterium]
MCSRGIVPGLERIRYLLAVMGNPEKDLNCIHVAGTNGKGSTSLIIAGILKQAGYRVGRFMSPHVHTYRERCNINGSDIKAADFWNYLCNIEAKIQIMVKKGLPPPTEFEVLTALALQYFKDSKVDIAVLEVGMGGIYDSTNVVTPLVSVITNVACDHTAFLGNTLEEIAANKAGIIKSGIPVVVGFMDSKAFQIIEEKAAREKSLLYPASLVQVVRRGRPDIKGQIVDIKYNDNRLDKVLFSLSGDFQLQNLAVSLTALLVLKQRGYSIDSNHIESALCNLKIPGRLEPLRLNPTAPVVADAAHNPDAARAIAASLENLFPGREKVLVCGLLDDKDAKEVLNALGENTRVCVVTRPESYRGCQWRRLKSIWQNLYPGKEVYEEEDITNAVSKGVDMLQEGEYLLIAGSFYILDKARRYFVSV